MQYRQRATSHDRKLALSILIHRVSQFLNFLYSLNVAAIADSTAIATLPKKRLQLWQSRMSCKQGRCEKEFCGLLTIQTGSL